MGRNLYERDNVAFTNPSRFSAISVPGKSVTFYSYWANRYLTFSKRLKNADAILQVDVCFFRLPPGFPSVPQYFNSVSVGPLLNQLDSPDFAWRTKNLLWGELNVLKQKLFVKSKKTIEVYR
jgi:hypothetical protein